MLESNTKKINRKIAVTLAFCSFSMISLLILNAIDIFTFSSSLVAIIASVGLITTFSPIILYQCGVPDEFLKYYMFFWMALLVGLLGCFNGIGIYITFVAVPVASCLYFDHKFTIICATFSYIIMSIAVYINSAGKMEVIYKGWSHNETFIAYMIGFSIEYIVIALFLSQIMNRAISIMKKQHDSYIQLKEQDYRYQLLVEGTEDVIFQYWLEEGKYSANRSIYAKKGVENIPIEVKKYDDMVSKYPQMQKFMNQLMESTEEGIRKYELDFSYEEDGVVVPLWYSCESFLMRDGEKLVSVIGKMHDITQVKVTQASLQKQRVSDMYLDVLQEKKKSFYDYIMDGSQEFGEEEFAKLARGHQFLVRMMDSLKYTADLDATLKEVLAQIASFFLLDRIGVFETDLTDGTNELTYQWNVRKDMELIEFMKDIGREAISAIARIYDQYGYIEVNPKHEIYSCGRDRWLRIDTKVQDAVLGASLWIPTLTDGDYNGAVYFDKYEDTPYTLVDKILLSEVVNMISAYITKLHAEQANKEKSLFLSTMTHEIRTPMNAIVGMTEVALREDMDDNIRKCLKTVQSSSFGLLSLVNDILDFSKIEAGKIDIVTEKYHTLSMVNDLMEIIKARNNNKLNLSLHISENFPSRLKGDVVRLKQVMINFCTNSIKYTDEGSVDIYFDYEKIDETTCRMKFSVKDTGIGIKEEDIGTLFKSYVHVDTKTNHHKEGTGLGLAISKQLVDLMDGEVDVDSEYGKGSTFSFTVIQEVMDWRPAGRLEDFMYEEGEDDPADAKPFTAPEANILIVDDTRINLKVAQALFRPLCVKVDLANDGYEAINKTRENKYDIIFMDYYMPGLDGVQTTQKIRGMTDNQNIKTPIVALTADIMTDNKKELFHQGMDDYLSKPIILEQAYQIFRRWLPKEKICEL